MELQDYKNSIYYEFTWPSGCYAYGKVSGALSIARAMVLVLHEMANKGYVNYKLQKEHAQLLVDAKFIDDVVAVVAENFKEFEDTEGLGARSANLGRMIPEMIACALIEESIWEAFSKNFGIEDMNLREKMLFACVLDVEFRTGDFRTLASASIFGAEEVGVQEEELSDRVNDELENSEVEEIESEMDNPAAYYYG